MNRSARKSRQSGATIIEFTLSLLFLVPLLLGTFVFGFRLVRAQQVDQITRDLAHMYSRGAEFSQSAYSSEAASLAGQFGLTSTGQTALIFSQITLETAADCTAATGNSNCTNVNQAVFVEQVAIGNATANQSVFGTPTSSGTLTATSGVSNNYSTTVSTTAQATNTWAVAKNFNSVISLSSMSAGQVIYMVEMYNNTPDLSIAGLTDSPTVYSRAIF